MNYYSFMRINFSLILEERRVWHKKEDKETCCKVVLSSCTRQVSNCHISGTLSSFFLICGTSAEVRRNPVVILISMQETVSLLLGVAFLLRRGRTGTTWPRNEHSANGYGTRRHTAVYRLVPLRFRTSLFTSGGKPRRKPDSTLL